MTVLIKGLDGERSGVGRRGRETEKERVEEGMDFPQGDITASQLLRRGTGVKRSLLLGDHSAADEELKLSMH